MSEGRNKFRGKKRGKRKNKEFMDAALEAFVRDQSLQKWNEVDGLMAGAEIDTLEAVNSSSEFLEKGPYREIWQRWWQQKVIDQKHDDNETLFEQIENAVQGAVLEEREIRKKQPKSLLEDSFEYKNLISRQMDNLLFEAGGEIEQEI